MYVNIGPMKLIRDYILHFEYNVPSAKTLLWEAAAPNS